MRFTFDKNMRAHLGFEVLFLTLVSDSNGSVKDSAEKSTTMNTAYTIKQSIGWYLKEYGMVPRGEPAALLQTLQGKNIEFNPRVLGTTT